MFMLCIRFISFGDNIVELNGKLKKNFRIRPRYASEIKNGTHPLKWIVRTRNRVADNRKHKFQCNYSKCSELVKHLAHQKLCELMNAHLKFENKANHYENDFFINAKRNLAIANFCKSIYHISIHGELF